GDLLGTAKELKRAVEATALAHEAEVAKAEAEASAGLSQVARMKKEQLAGVDRPVEDLDELEDRAARASVVAAEVLRDVDRRRAAEKERNRIREEGLGDEPPLETAIERESAAGARVSELRKALAEAETELKLAAEKLESVREAHQAWAARRETLETPVAGPSEAELEEAEQAEADAMAAITAWSAYSMIDELSASVAKQKAIQAQEAEAAAKARSVAGQVMVNLQKLLRAQDFGQIVVSAEGRVCHLDHETGLTQPLDRLSDGQLARAVITQIGVKVYSSGYMPLHPKLWTDLDPWARLELVETVLDNDVRMLSEAPWINSGIRMQTLGREWCDRMRDWLDQQDPEAPSAVVGFEDLVGVGIAVPGGGS
ncbi:MAG: hypothetical protein AAFX50_18860, partial [Acidobacteriota bacterium]